MAVADRLYRSRDDRVLAGVAGGLAETVDADPSIIRVVWAILAILTGGLALLVYIVMAIVVPEGPDREVGASAMPGAPSSPGAAPASGATPASGADAASGPAPQGSWIAPDGSTVPMASAAATSRGRRRRRDPADRGPGALVAGILLILLGGFFLVRQLMPSIDLGLWWPVAAIAFGVLLVILSVIPPRTRA
jgi:phage shock protein C